MDRRDREALDRWISREDPEPYAVEIVLYDVMDDDGQFPDDLPFDEAECECGAHIGAGLVSDDDGYEHEHWFPTWLRTADEVYVCEDCSEPDEAE